MDLDSTHYVSFINSNQDKKHPDNTAPCECLVFFLRNERWNNLGEAVENQKHKNKTKQNKNEKTNTHENPGFRCLS